MSAGDTDGGHALRGEIARLCRERRITSYSELWFFLAEHGTAAQESYAAEHYAFFCAFLDSLRRDFEAAERQPRPSGPRNGA